MTNYTYVSAVNGGVYYNPSSLLLAFVKDTFELTLIKEIFKCFIHTATNNKVNDFPPLFFKTIKNRSSNRTTV